MKSYIVLGAGRFGTSVAKSLFKMGCDVLVIDYKEERVSEIADYVTKAVIGDCCDKNLLMSLGVRNFDGAIVAIGTNMESSILVTLILKEMNIPMIIAKAKSKLHGDVLSRVGADRIVMPEIEMGEKIARGLVKHNIMDYIELSDGYSVAELAIPLSWVGKSISNIDVRRKYGVNILAVKSENMLNVTVSPEYTFKTGDIVVVSGSDENLNRVK